MKKKFFAVLCLIGSGIFLNGCLEEPGSVGLTASKTTIAIDEQVTLTLSGVENSTCIQWTQSGGPSFEAVSPIDANDMSVTVKFASAGTVKMLATVKNCKKGTDGCTGKCSDAHSEIELTIEE